MDQVSDLGLVCGPDSLASQDQALRPNTNPSMHRDWVPGAFYHPFPIFHTGSRFWSLVPPLPSPAHWDQVPIQYAGPRAPHRSGNPAAGEWCQHSPTANFWTWGSSEGWMTCGSGVEHPYFNDWKIFKKNQLCLSIIDWFLLGFMAKAGLLQDTWRGEDSSFINQFKKGVESVRWQHGRRCGHICLRSWQMLYINMVYS